MANKEISPLTMYEGLSRYSLATVLENMYYEGRFFQCVVSGEHLNFSQEFLKDNESIKNIETYFNDSLITLNFR